MRLAKYFGLCLATLALAVPACSVPDEEASPSAHALAGLTKAQRLEELDALATGLRAFYGPLEYKQRRLGFDFDRALTEARAEEERAVDDTDHVVTLARLLGSLRDAHLAIGWDFLGDPFGDAPTTFSLPFSVSYFGGQYIVIDDGVVAGIAVGDELVSIDGKSTQELEDGFAPFGGGGRFETIRQWGVARSMTLRGSRCPRELRPRNDSATVVLRRDGGGAKTVRLPWDKGTSSRLESNFPLPIAADAPARAPAAVEVAPPPADKRIRHGYDFFSAGTPFFVTDATRGKFSLTEVFPKPETLKELGVELPADDATRGDWERRILFRAYKYSFEGKTILLVRIRNFMSNQPSPSTGVDIGKLADFFTPEQDANHEENTKWLAGLLRDNMPDAEHGGADVAVFDVTQNPGGAIRYAQGLVALLTDKPFGGFMLQVNADRGWIQSFLGAAQKATVPEEQAEWITRVKAVEAAIDEGLSVTKGVPVTGAYFHEDAVGHPMMKPNAFVHWTKPVLALTNELTNSCGDLFPAAIKQNRIGKTFGATSTGGGGNIETALTLPYSRINVTMTRSLAYVHDPQNPVPRDEDLIENNGVSPDYPYEPTARDARAGFVDYFAAFSRVAAELKR